MPPLALSWSYSQETCTKRYTRRQPYAAASYYTPLSVTGRTRSEEEDDLDVQIPCEHCDKLIPRSLLTRHQVRLSLSPTTSYHYYYPRQYAALGAVQQRRLHQESLLLQSQPDLHYTTWKPAHCL